MKRRRSLFPLDDIKNNADDLLEWIYSDGDVTR